MILNFRLCHKRTLRLSYQIKEANRLSNDTESPSQHNENAFDDDQ